MKKFTLSIVSLTAFLLGLIWAVGTGEATEMQKAAPIYLADTIHIDLEDKSEEIDIDAETKAEESRETLFREIKKLNQTVYDIKNRYMEDIGTSELINAGIKGMLKNLDRYSVLMEKKSYDRLMESTHGKYEGLGMEIDSRHDYITVVTPMEGTPAYRVGLQSGDQIRKIDGTTTYKMTTSDAAKLMRGKAGTSVKLEIMREGLAEPLDFIVERAVIELKSVNYFGVIDGTNIGYVRLSRFAEETSQELRDAISELNKKGIESLIFDLRSNGGGLLQQAVETAELFVDEGRLVVYTRGKFAGSERRHYSKQMPLFPDKPLIVLVNEGTASASEIVAGAIQDWDRGIIVGYPTYGKGLVQQIFPIGSDGDVALKLTTAKYYIPSGRCIQKAENEKKISAQDGIAVVEDDEAEGEDEGESEGEIDSMTISDDEVYYTNGGRAVYGGGGILPDVELEEDRIYKPIEINLERERQFFDFAVKYVASHPRIRADIEIDDSIIDEFRKFLKEVEFSYKTALEVSLEEMKELIEEDNKEAIFGEAVTDFESLVVKEKDADFIISIDYIKRAIKREIASKIGGQRSVYEEVILQTDVSVIRAIEILKNKAEYSRILEEGQNKDHSSIESK